MPQMHEAAAEVFAAAMAEHSRILPKRWLRYAHGVRAEWLLTFLGGVLVGAQRGVDCGGYPEAPAPLALMREDER